MLASTVMLICFIMSQSLYSTLQIYLYIFLSYSLSSSKSATLRRTTRNLDPESVATTQPLESCPRVLVLHPTVSLDISSIDVSPPRTTL